MRVLGGQRDPAHRTLVVRVCGALVTIAVDERTCSTTFSCPLPPVADHRGEPPITPTLPIPSPRRARMNTITSTTPMSTLELSQIIEHALRDLKRARDANDRTAIARSERRMNAMLDQLAKRLRTHRDDVRHVRSGPPEVVSARCDPGPGRTA